MMNAKESIKSTQKWDLSWHKRLHEASRVNPDILLIARALHSIGKCVHNHREEFGIFQTRLDLFCVRFEGRGHLLQIPALRLCNRPCEGK
jgi:hypothetical protein